MGHSILLLRELDSKSAKQSYRVFPFALSACYAAYMQ